MRILSLLRSNLAYAFFATGVAWLVVVYVTGAVLNLWPVVACLMSGVLIKIRPGERLTWAWSVSSATLGFLLSAYQTYAWVPLLSGSFGTLGAISIVVFAAFAMVHALLLYTGRVAPSKQTR